MCIQDNISLHKSLHLRCALHLKAPRGLCALVRLVLFKTMLKDVRHVPDIRLNSISIDKLDDKGFINSFGESKWKLTKGSLVLARGNKQNTLYVMEAKLHKEDINVVQQDGRIELWHRRLGHISEKRLQNLDRKKTLLNLQGMPLKACDHCLVRKAHGVAFHTNPPSRRPNVIDLIHTNVHTMKTRTIGGALYFVTFIDDHSRKFWGFAMKTKDHVLDAFKELHAKFEREK